MNGRIPHIRAEFPPADGTIGRRLYAHGKGHTGPMRTLQDGVQLGVGAKAKLALEFHDVGDTIPKVHETRIVPKGDQSSQKWSPRLNMHHLDIPPDNSGMVRKRPESPMNHDLFIEEAKKWEERENKGHVDLAGAIDISLAYLHKLLYKIKPLTLQVVEKAAPVFGRSVRDFLTENTPDEAGVIRPQLPRDEAFGNIMAIIGPNLTDEFKERLKQLALAAQVGPTPEEVRAERDKAKAGAGKTAKLPTDPRDTARQVVLQRARIEDRYLTSRELELLKMTEQEKKEHRKSVPALAKKGKGGK